MCLLRDIWADTASEHFICLVALITNETTLQLLLPESSQARGLLSLAFLSYPGPALFGQANGKSKVVGPFPLCGISSCQRPWLCCFCDHYERGSHLQALVRKESSPGLCKA